MTLAEFLTRPNTTLTGVEFIDESTILNIVVNDGELFALNVDTSHITDNRQVDRVTVFTLTDNILEVNDHVFDTSTMEMAFSYRRV